MTIESYPVPYQSAFRPAPFVLGGVAAPSGIDVSVLPASGGMPLGVKRFYGTGEIAVNAAPYVRGLLSPKPLCGEAMGMISDQRRFAGCRVSAPGITSAVVYLTAGTENAPVGTILSAAPETLRIRPGEKDEISLITAGSAVKPLVLFAHGGTDHTVDMLAANTGSGMHTFVVDAEAVADRFAAMTGAGPRDLTGFTVMLRVSMPGGDLYLTRRYEVCANRCDGCRLAWVNRFGAVDYYTFPVVAERVLSGSRERIRTAEGWRAVSTAAGGWTTLVSEYEPAETLGWLAEVFSSPSVWMVAGNSATAVDVADASAGFDPLKPGTLVVKVRPMTVTVSRNF